MAHETTFVENLHHLPDADWTSGAFSVLRAGKVAAGTDYGVRRQGHVGQDILFCLSGAGTVETPGQRIDVQPGQIVWIANEAPHAHIADPRTPWTVLWFRLDGPQPAAMRRKLFGEGPPRVTIAQGASLIAWFERLFAALRGRDLSLDFRLNQLVGEFLTMLDRAAGGASEGGAAGPLTAVIAAIRADLSRQWTADELEDLMQCSPSQIRRLFLKNLRESPRRWLLRERLIHAQSLMIRDGVPLAKVAEDCGFCDVYHFSREFKRFVGTSPAAWRRREIGASGSS